ncbi:hypothetical protein Tco_0661081 [Tanacetum coccineum]
MFIPSPVDGREDIPEAELPPHKRLCLTALTSMYEVGESSTAAPRPTGGHRADYRFIGTMDAEIRRQRAEEVGYGIRDVWVDLTEAVEEVAPTTLEGVNARVIELAAFHLRGSTELLNQEALVSREAWAHSVGLSSVVHYELQAYRTHLLGFLDPDKAPMPFPSEEEVERLLALPPPPPSPLISLSPPSTEERLARCLAAPVLPSSPLPPLPVSLFIPPPVDRREDILEAELPPRKRLCLTALTSRYEVGESLTVTPRPTGGHGVYMFIGTMDAEIRRQRAEEVGYDIRDVWVDPTEAVEEVAPTTLDGVNARVTELAAVEEQETQDIDAAIEDGGPSFPRGLGTFRWVSSLQGQLSAALGQIQALQARDQTHADDPKGAGSSA